MSANAVVLDENDPRPAGRATSVWRRAVTAGLGAGLVILLAGDRGARGAVPPGIDPLDILSLSVRANAIVVLDSSGSMRERPDATDLNANGLLNTPAEGEVAGDDPNSKMFAAKQVLKTIIRDNQTKVSFEFGRYQQDSGSYGPETRRFLYTCTTVASGLEQACTGANADRAWDLLDAGEPGLFRADADERTAGGVTTYHLFSTTYHVNKRYRVQSNNDTLCSSNPTPAPSSTWTAPTPATNWNLTANEPPFIEIQRYGNTGCTGSNAVTRWYFRGIRWTKGNDLTSSCGGYDDQVGLASCGTTDQFTGIGPFLDPEVVPTTTDGDTPANLRAGTTGIRSSGPTPIAESLIDIKTNFDTVKWTTILPLTPKPRTFVIVVTDGDDTCSSSSTFNGLDGDTALDSNARRAAYRAQLLYQGIANSATPPATGVDPASQVRTFVVVLGANASAERANWIAWGGSGMSSDAPTDGPENDGTRWTSNPTAAQRAACSTCIDALLVSNTTELTAALQAAIDQGQSEGEFSDQQSITESVFEFAASVTLPSPSPDASPVPSPDPLNPESRYSSSVPVLLQSTFEMPGFKGHLNAFRNVSGAAAPAWDDTEDGSDAAQKLYDRVFGALNPSPGPLHTFATIRGGASSTDSNIADQTGPVIRRRIYTTPQNGVFINATFTAPSTYAGGRSNAQRVTDLQDNNAAATTGPVTFRIPIWPPSAEVDPAGTAGTSYPAGILDNALGIGPNPLPPPTGGTAPAALTFAQLQTLFGACTRGFTGTTAVPTSGGSLPPDCRTTTGTPALQLQLARKEARQIILAFTAGASLVTNNNLALRTHTTGDCLSGTEATRDTAFNGTTCGAMQFRARDWLMAESTLAAPGVVTPPLQTTPGSHDLEYQLYRDGPRTTDNPPVAADDGGSVLLGLGLRNPDDDGPDDADTDRMRLKPVMSVVYHATNGMLHAFRAGPCRDASAGNVCQDGTTEAGGEELWAFVPFDMLQNLKERMKTQTRDTHTYMIAAPVRFSDVFVPGAWSRTIGSTTVSGDGVWRTVLVFGRGIAGKYYTALDVTAPGPFTEGSLETKPFIPLWSRGNPDTRDGTSGGTANGVATGPTDTTQYAKMGQTWSVPALANVNASDNVTDRVSGGVEFVAYTGSGFGSTDSEGSTFFTLDLLTGDVVASVDVGDRSSPPFQNAIVAGPSAFNEAQLTPPNIAKVAVTTTSRVYFGDVNGRIWRVRSNTPGSATELADFGADQPIANSLALLNYKGSGTTERPHIFAETGNDNRVPASPSPMPTFKMFGLRDDDLTTDPVDDDVDGPVVKLFSIDFPAGFRGNVSPATAFNDASPPLGRVFFAGNKFNPFGTTPPCFSTFDAILFAVGADSGSAAFDLNATGDDRSITTTGQRVQAVRVAGGRLVLDTGLGADLAPPPPAPPVELPPQPSLQADIFFGPQPTALVLSQQSPLIYRVGSGICK